MRFVCSLFFFSFVDFNRLNSFFSLLVSYNFVILNSKLISMVQNFRSEQIQIFPKFHRFFLHSFSTTLTINRFGIFPICCKRRAVEGKKSQRMFRCVRNSLLLTPLFVVACLLFHNKFRFVYPRYSPRQHLLLLSRSWVYEATDSLFCVRCACAPRFNIGRITTI